MRPKSRSGVHAREMFVDLGVLGSEGKHALALQSIDPFLRCQDGIPRIDTKIQEYLMELGGIAVDRPQVRRVSCYDLDVPRERLSHDLPHFGDQMFRLNQDSLAFRSP